jgi:hypothetical protein
VLAVVALEAFLAEQRDFGEPRETQPNARPEVY